MSATFETEPTPSDLSLRLAEAGHALLLAAAHADRCACAHTLDPAAMREALDEVQRLALALADAATTVSLAGATPSTPLPAPERTHTPGSTLAILSATVRYSFAGQTFEVRRDPESAGVVAVPTDEPADFHATEVFGSSVRGVHARGHWVSR